MPRRILKEFYRYIRKNRKIVKFIISGSVATMVDILFLAFFTEIIDLWYVYSAILSFTIAFVISFGLQKFWTFRDHHLGIIRKQLALYFLIAVVSMLINAHAIYFLVEYFSLHYLIAQIIIVAIIGSVNFFIYNFIIFKKEYQKAKKRKNILIATGIYPPSIGGPATYSKMLLDELPKYGFNVKVITYGDLELNAREVIVVNRNSNIFLRYFKYFWQVWKLRSWADIVYVQGPISEGIPSFLACCLKEKKYILKIVGDYAWEQGRQRWGINDNLDEFQNKRYGLIVEFVRFLEKTVTRKATKIIVPSNYLKNIIKTWGIKEEKIEVIYNTVNFKELKQSKEDLKKKLNLSGNIILSIGRLVPWKGFDVLIEIMPEILKFNPQFKLLIIGDGPEKNNLENKIKRYNLKDEVLLVGKVEHKKIQEIMTASDIFILNSAYEGLSHVLVEAQLSKIPVMASRIGGNVEVVQDKEAGILFDYNNQDEIKEKIIWLWQNNSFRKKIIENAFIFAKKTFSREKMLEDIKKVLCEF